MVHVVVGRHSKSYESDQGIRLTRSCLWARLYCHENFVSRLNKNIIIFWIALIFVGCSPSKNQSEENKADTNDLPAITLMMITGEKVMANTLPGNSILIFFGPDCDHCQRQAESMRLQLDTFENYSLYFIASNPITEIARFAETYQLRGYPNIFFAQADGPEVMRVLGPLDVPTIYIYSGDRSLVKKFINQTKVYEIAKFL